MTILRNHQTYELNMAELKRAHDAYEILLDEHEIMKAIQELADNLLLDQPDALETLFESCKHECRIRHGNSMLDYDDILSAQAIKLGMWTH